MLSENIEKEVLARLEKFEQERQKLVVKHRKKVRAEKRMYTLLWVVVIGGILTSWVPLLNFITIPALIVAGAFLVYHMFFSKDHGDPYELFREKYKTNIVGYAISTMHPELSYMPNQNISKRHLANSRLFNNLSQYSGEDFLSGTYSDCALQFGEVHLEGEKEKFSVIALDTYTDVITLFKGSFFVLDFHKEFKGGLIVLSKKDAINKKLIKKKNFHGLPKLKMDHTSFNEKFQVYCNHEQLAFYLLSPAFMEGLIKLTKNHQSIRMSVIKDKLYIGLHNNLDLFECDIEKGLPDMESFKNIDKEIRWIKSIISILQQDKRIWKVDIEEQKTDQNQKVSRKDLKRLTNEPFDPVVLSKPFQEYTEKHSQKRALLKNWQKQDYHDFAFSSSNSFSGISKGRFRKMITNNHGEIGQVLALYDKDKTEMAIYSNEFKIEMIANKSAIKISWDGQVLGALSVKGLIVDKDGYLVGEAKRPKEDHLKGENAARLGKNHYTFRFLNQDIAHIWYDPYAHSDTLDFKDDEEGRNWYPDKVAEPIAIGVTEEQQKWLFILTLLESIYQDWPWDIRNVESVVG